MTANRPKCPPVSAGADALAWRRTGGAGGWAGHDLQHVTPTDGPRVLAELHRALPVGAPLEAELGGGGADRPRPSGGEGGHGPSGPGPSRPGGTGEPWTTDAMVATLVGAGFGEVAVAVATENPTDRRTHLRVRARRERTLADSVGPGMGLLVCGLNPSLHAADAGVGYVGPGNRFWPALAAAGLAPPGTDRCPWALLDGAGIGMTDLVKRATPRADMVAPDEFRAGLVRVSGLCERLGVPTVCLVGLAGWRAATRATAGAGWQRGRLGPSRIYVMPSTSGLNARTPLGVLVEHLRAAAADLR